MMAIGTARLVEFIEAELDRLRSESDQEQAKIEALERALDKLKNEVSK